MCSISISRYRFSAQKIESAIAGLLSAARGGVYTLCVTSVTDRLMAPREVARSPRLHKIIREYLGDAVIAVKRRRNSKCYVVSLPRLKRGGVRLVLCRRRRR